VRVRQEDKGRATRVQDEVLPSHAHRICEVPPSHFDYTPPSPSPPFTPSLSPPLVILQIQHLPQSEATSRAPLALARVLVYAHLYVLIGLAIFAAALLLVEFWEGGERRGETEGSRNKERSELLKGLS
jgi:hypothetical protein